MNHEREELESKLTALLLGELPADEAAALRQAMEQDAELAALYERLKPTVELVRESAAEPAGQTAPQPKPLKLSAERRERLMAQFKTVAPKEFKRPARSRVFGRLVEIAAVVAILAVLAGLTIQTKSHFRRGEADFSKSGEALESKRWASDSSAASPMSVTVLAQTEKNADAVKFYTRGKTEIILPPGDNLADGRFGSVYAVRSEPTLSAGDSVAFNQKPYFSDDKTASGNNSEVIGWWPAGGLEQATVTTSSGRTAEQSVMLGSVVQKVPVLGDMPLIRSLRDATETSDGNGNFAKGIGSGATLDVQPNTLHTWTTLQSGVAVTNSAVVAANGAVAPAQWNFDGPSTLRLGRANGGETTFSGGMAAQNNSRGRPPEVAQDWSRSTAFNRDPATVPARTLREPPMPSIPGAINITKSASTDPNTGLPAAAPPLEGLSDLATAAPAKNAPLETRTFRVDRETFKQGLESVGVVVAGADAGGKASGMVGGTGGGGGGGGRGPADVQDGVRLFYDAVGVQLNAEAGKDLVYDDQAGTITVRATAKELDVIEAANRALAVPPQVKSEARFAVVGSNSVRDIKYAWQGDNQLIKESRDQIVGQAGTAGPSNVIAANVAGYVNVRLPETNLVHPAFRKNEQEIRDAQAKMEKRAPQDAPSASMTVETLRHMEAMRIEAKAQQVKQQHLLTALQGLKREELRKALPIAIEDNQLVTLRSELDVAEAAAIKNKNDLGIENPDSKKAEERVKELTRKIDERMDGVMAGLQAQVDSLGQYVGSLKKEIDTAWQLDIAQAQKSAGPYLEARKLEELKGFNPRSNADADRPMPKPAVPLPVPQPEVLVRENAFSTFSMNVSDVSFKLAMASLEKGVLPEAASIRSEEFINAFDYRDPEPTPGSPIAFAADRARYPFAHNRDLLRFSLKTAAAGRQPGRPLNLVLLLDNSGSMERADRVRIIREALRVLAGQLQPQDKFSVITFSRTPRLWVDGVSGTNAGSAAEEVGKITPEGGTNLGDALDLAYATAVRHYLANGVNRVVLLTDGAANLGNVNPGALKLKVETHRKQGVALDCFGIGWEGFNDDLLEVLSRNGDGRYGFINTPEEAASGFAAQLAGALNVAASDVKVQVEFNPNRVTAYRQVGYAKHQLTKEQFRDNTVDAAEIAAAESGNALYVVEVNPSGEGPLATVRVRYKVPGTGDYREQAWAVPYAGHAGPLEQAAPAMRLAATASAFSEWLAASPYAGEVSPNRLLGYLGDVPGVYGADSRPKKLEWMIRQAGSIPGK